MNRRTLTPEPLKLLLMKAGYGPTEFWCALFRWNECALISGAIVCPDLETRERLERTFGVTLRLQISDLRFECYRGAVATPKPLPPSCLKKHTPQKFWSHD